MLLIFDLFKTNRITKENKYIFMFLSLLPFVLIIYWVRDGFDHRLSQEIIWFSKPLFFLLLLNYIHQNHSYFQHRLDKIMRFNLFIYAIPIIISSIIGFGVSSYDAFYSATRSFFYGQNVTSITGLVLCVYYIYKVKIENKNLIYFSLAFAGLYLSGGKIILLIPVLSFVIILLKDRSIKKTVIAIMLLFFILINPVILLNNSFTQKYYTRAIKNEILHPLDRSTIDNPLVWYYSYLSVTRAQRVDYALSNIMSDPQNIFFGCGVDNFQGKFDSRFSNLMTTESDLIDMYLYYGIIGFIIIFLPIFKIMFPLIFRGDLSINSMIVYLLFCYSVFAGHVLTTPMAGSLFALFLGVATINKKTPKGYSIRLMPKT